MAGLATQPPSDVQRLTPRSIFSKDCSSLGRWKHCGRASGACSCIMSWDAHGPQNAPNPESATRHARIGTMAHDVQVPLHLHRGFGEIPSQRRWREARRTTRGRRSGRNVHAFRTCRTQKKTAQVGKGRVEVGISPTVCLAGPCGKSLRPMSLARLQRISVWRQTPGRC